MNPKRKQYRITWALALALFILLAAFMGCGDPESPVISNILITYWEAATETWISIPNGGTAEGSPVRIQGDITDNTAVVDPTMTMIADRRDQEFQEGGAFQGKCNGESDDFFECEMDCTFVEGQDYSVCSPALSSSALIRGDRFVLTLKADVTEVQEEETAEQGSADTDEETFELEILVREAVKLDPGGQNIEQEYRILKVYNIQGDPNPFLWALEYRKTGGGNWSTLRSGDYLLLTSGDDLFQLRVKKEVTQAGETAALKTYTLKDAPEATLESMVKWNQFSGLGLAAKTGGFEGQFNFFDPRVTLETDEEPLYRFLLAAQDVPDQGDGSIRYADENNRFEVLFSPPEIVPLPDIEVSGLEEGETVDTTVASSTLLGTVWSGAGEVESLEFILSNGGDDEDPDKPSLRERVLSFPPQSLTLSAGFSIPLELVSDWGKNCTKAAEDPVDCNIVGGEGGIVNELKVVAFSMREGDVEVKAGETTNRVEKVYTYEFLSPESTESPPSIDSVEISPLLSDAGEGFLPVIPDGEGVLKAETMRVWARASDDNGQPGVSYGWCSCISETGWIDSGVWNDRCGIDRDELEVECKDGTIPEDDLNASGQFPQNPWDWMKVTPYPGMEKCDSTDPNDQEGVNCSNYPFTNVAVFTAIEQEGERGEPLMTTMEIVLEQEEEEASFLFPVPKLVNSGPTVTLDTSEHAEDWNAVDGKLLCPQEDDEQGWTRDDCLKAVFKFTGSERIIPNQAMLNRIIALYNGENVGEVSYDPGSHAIKWDLGIRKWDVKQGIIQGIKQGDKICLGAESTTGRIIEGKEPDPENPEKCPERLKQRHIDGHKTIKLFEFLKVGEETVPDPENPEKTITRDLLLVGVTTTSDEKDCFFGDECFNPDQTIFSTPFEE